jgi:uroporphyrinogen decarboxylase
MTNPLLDVLSGRLPARRPIWFMRQAGRYLPEYRKVRAEAGSFLDLCYTPRLAAEVTLQPLRRYDLDAAILFADILVVPQAMGLGVRFAEGEGPILEKVGNAAEVGRLKPLSSSTEVAKVCETVSLLRKELSASIGLIGFCGGPWTVASYMVEGGTSDRANAKRAALGSEPWFSALIDRLVQESVEYLSLQIEAGAQAVQIFDSWAGELPGRAGDAFVVDPLCRMVAALKKRHPEVPVIVFGRGFGVRQPELAIRTGANAIGLESELPMRWAAENVGQATALQGNLDPVALQCDPRTVRAETRAVLEAIPMSRHIFNLGHGIRQGTDPGIITEVVTAVRDWDKGVRGE